jgi:hypothetical protein
MLGKFSNISKGDKIRVVKPGGKGEKDFVEVDQPILNFVGQGVISKCPIDPTCKVTINGEDGDPGDLRPGDDLDIRGFPCTEIIVYRSGLRARA